MALVMLVMGILIALVAVGLMLLCVALVAGLVFGLSSAHANAGWGALAGVIVGVAAVWAIIWVGLRWSLALPLTFAEGRFRLFESWALTRGHALKLFGLSVVLAVIVGVIGMVAECVLAVIVLSAVGLAHLDASSINAFLSQPPQVWLPAVAPWLALAAVARMLHRRAPWPPSSWRPGPRSIATWPSRPRRRPPRRGNRPRSPGRVSTVACAGPSLDCESTLQGSRPRRCVYDGG